MPGSSSGPNVSRHWGPPQACTACSRHKKIQKKIYFRNSKVWLCNLTSSGWGGVEFCLSSMLYPPLNPHTDCGMDFATEPVSYPCS